MAFTNIYKYVRKTNERHLQFYTNTSATWEDLENELILILWSHNNFFMIVKICGVLGTPLKQGHEVKNTNLNV
jgi:hypothetical protein